MSYNINKTNGSKLAVVDDGSINISACDLTLVGKNYAGYGQGINENLVKLLENFANSRQPSTPLTGQLWYDTLSKKLKFYSGTEFKSIPSLVTSTRTSGLTAGDLWYDENRKQLFYWNGSAEELIGPQTVEQNATGIVFSTLNDTSGDPHFVLLHQIQASPDSLDVITVAVTSADEFTIGSPTLDGFSKIIQGMTFINSDPSTGETTDPIIWGSASDAHRLGGKLSSEYVTYDNPTFTSAVIINNDNGVNIQGNNLRLSIHDDGGTNIARLSSRLTRMDFNVSSTVGGTSYNIFRIDATAGLAILPSSSAGQTTDIGSSSSKFNDVYATTFNGNLTGTPTVPSIVKSGTNGVGDIGETGNRFGTIWGTASSALYADLAEKYLSDINYDPGTVLEIGGTKEVTICTSYGSVAVAGIVTTKPAYLMNDGLEGGVAIALKGRVPCKVIGPVKKGDLLYPSDFPGHAEVKRNGVVTDPASIIAKALQDFDGEQGVIEVMVY